MRADTLSCKKILGLFALYFVVVAASIAVSMLAVPRMLMELQIRCSNIEIDPEYDEFCHNTALTNGSRWSGNINNLSGLNQFLTIIMKPSIDFGVELEEGEFCFFVLMTSSCVLVALLDCYRGNSAFRCFCCCCANSTVMVCQLHANCPVISQLQ